MEWFAAPELEQARWLLQRALALVYLLASSPSSTSGGGCLVAVAGNHVLGNHFGTIAAYRLGE
jgi:hypothetical protein